MTADAARSFDAFYRGTSRRVLGYAYALTGDLADAQDLTQEAYVRAWQHWSRISSYESAEVWLRTVLFHLATDRWRRVTVRRLFAARQRPPADVPPPSEDTLLVVSLLRSLPVDQRRALALHYLLDRPVEEIAVEVGAPVGTVKSWLSRGRSALSASLSVSLSVKGASDA
ncbi:SigE family RNA polymerase sigma factor [Dactylosporangium sp. NPDC005572]|uniref:SigE family RNA polymerase sigma factor n=1 Tax=Dactylosporangium sp. NPDC005572 TaxID=3156889 RepID=UPI0033A8A59A